jgi:hypothetical protein
MNEQKLEEIRCSLVFVVPKQRFFMWLEEVHNRSGRRAPFKYFEEEDLACLIPPLGTFSQSNLQLFMNELKPKLLIKALGGVVTDSSDLPEINANTFDDFFTLKTRDIVWSAKSESDTPTTAT